VPEQDGTVASPYDWERNGEIEAPDANPGILNGTIEAEWIEGDGWRLSIDRVTDEGLRLLLGGSVAGALVGRRDGAGQQKGGNAGEAEEPDVVNPEPAPTSWERHGDYDG
jgi:hypothetical protein